MLLYYYYFTNKYLLYSTILLDINIEIKFCNYQFFNALIIIIFEK